ncbi:MAG: TonB-dependent receptor [Acidobacteriota bacterium]
MSHRRFPILLVCAALIVLSSASGIAQSPPGRISGTVRVANGAPVGGATVTITNQDTGATRVVKSSSNGSYEVTDLPPGLYTLSVDVQGFRRAIQKDRRLDAGGTLSVDLSLEVKIAEEVTVTAMKREETILNTPVSVAAPTEEVLRERGVDSLEGVAANVAGFAVQNLGPGQNQVSMRGVSSGQIARDQPGVKEGVGAYLDESVISLSLFTPDIDLFDMNRVEVLRGPQGTLFGSGSESGTVRYITNQPELGVTRYFGELAGNTISGGNQGGNAKFGINAPVGSTAALRIVGYYDRIAGYTDAVQPNLSVDKNVNTGDRTGLRAAFEFAPDDRLTIIPRVVYQKVKMDGWNREDAYNILANPFTTTRPPVRLGERQIFTQIDEPFNDKFFLGDVNVKYNFGDVTLTSVTSYTHRDIDVVRDAGALTSSITGGSFGLPPSVYNLNSPLDDATKANALTQELRVSGGKADSRFNWVAGGFYGNSRRAYSQQLHVAGYEAMNVGPFTNTRTVAPPDVLFFSDLSYKLDQFALFGEGTLAVTEKFSVTAGLRYYHFSEDKKQIFDGLFGADGNGQPQSQPGSTKADGVAPRFIASYKVTDSTNLNAQVSKGFRLGGVNDPLNVNLCTAQDRITFGGRENWKDEKAWNYEIGSKSRLFGGRGSFNASLFYVDINDLQATVTAGSCSSRVIFNVPKARSMGGELEFAAAVTDHFDFSVSGSYNDATLRSTLTSTDPGGNVSVVSGIQSGKRLPSVPRFQAALAATYQQPITPDFNGYFSATYNHVGSRFTQVGDDLLGTLNLNSFGANAIGGPLTASTFTYDPELPAYDLVNLRLGVRHANWDVALYCNNLTDELARLALDQERGTRARIGYLTNQPRTIGITTRIDF